jgi:hypothetical protein
MSVASHGQGPPRSIPLVTFVESEDGGPGRFALGSEALGVLAALRMPVAPVAVVGKYRTGKSFLLNRLLQRRGGFEVGPTVEACTKGINMWSEPIIVEQEDGSSMAAIFLDTEGIGATGSTAEHDARIFALATLLSSLLIYNSVGAVDEEAIQSISFIANLTKLIQMRSGGGRTETGVAAAAPLQDAASDISGSEGEEEGGGADSDDDADDDDDDDLRGAVVGAGGGSGRDSYVDNLRRDARKRMAAAKRARAARIMEEKRRMRGMRELQARGGADGFSSAGGDGGGSPEGEQEEVSAFFPSFLWVLRDFVLDLVDEVRMRGAASEELSCFPS